MEDRYAVPLEVWYPKDGYGVLEQGRDGRSPVEASKVTDAPESGRPSR